MKTVWHYSKADRLEAIRKSGEILPATAGIPPWEIPAVWLSTAAQWENTATPGIIDESGRRDATFSEMLEESGGLLRIEINPKETRLIPPLLIQRKLKIDKTTWRGLVGSARDGGADPSQWFCVAGSIPAAAWGRIEICREFNPFRWEPATDELVAEVLAEIAGNQAQGEG